MPTNPFITVHTSDDEVQQLIEVGLPLMGSDGRIKWAAVETLTGIKYSRGWLILRHEFLAANNPSAFVDVKAAVAAATARATEEKRLNEFNADRDVLSPIVVELREVKELSWGEIAVRCSLPESKIRSAFKLAAGKKDRGLRIGKGGRFAFGDPTLYLENMKHEGAMIPGDLVGRPAREQCLNYVAPEAPAAKPVRKPRAKKVAAA